MRLFVRLENVNLMLPRLFTLQRLIEMWIEADVSIIQGSYTFYWIYLAPRFSKACQSGRPLLLHLIISHRKEKNVPCKTDINASIHGQCNGFICDRKLSNVQPSEHDDNVDTVVVIQIPTDTTLCIHLWAFTLKYHRVKLDDLSFHVDNIAGFPHYIFVLYAYFQGELQLVIHEFRSERLPSIFQRRAGSC